MIILENFIGKPNDKILWTAKLTRSKKLFFGKRRKTNEELEIWVLLYLLVVSNIFRTFDF